MFGIQESSVTDNENSKNDIEDTEQVMQQDTPHKEALHVSALRDAAAESSVEKQRNRNEQIETLLSAMSISELSPRIVRDTTLGDTERNARDQIQRLKNYIYTCSSPAL